MGIRGRITLAEEERKRLCELAETYHYMHKSPSVRSYPFGWSVAWDGKRENENGEPYGFIIYSLIHFTRMKGEFGYPGLPTQWQVLSLSRLWLHDDLPRNSETHVIGMSMKMLQRRWLEIHPPVFLDLPYHIVKVISYCELKHFKGTIYRAANFREFGRTKRRAVKSGSGARRSPTEESEMICFIYDLKEPRWSYQDLAEEK